MDRALELENVRLFHARPFGEFIERYSEPGMERHIRCVTAFAGGVKPIVELIKDRKADFYPIPLSKLPWLFKEGPQARCIHSNGLSARQQWLLQPGGIS